MKDWNDKEKMIPVIMLGLALAFVLGVFVGRFSTYNIYALDALYTAEVPMCL